MPLEELISITKSLGYTKVSTPDGIVDIDQYTGTERGGKYGFDTEGTIFTDDGNMKWFFDHKLLR